METMTDWMAYLEQGSLSLVFWLVLASVLVLIELMTVGFFIIFFAMGAFLTAGVAFFIPSLPLQLVCFIVFSLALLLFARPMVRDMFQVSDKPKVPSNVDALVGQAVLVLEPVTDIQGKVKVLHTGEAWSAILDPNSTIETLETDGRGTVIGINGAKLVVSPQ